MEYDELKKQLVDSGLSEEHADTLIQFGNESNRLKEDPKSFGSFKVYVDNDNSIVISSLSGWKVVYPPMTNAWVYLLTWMNNWDECSEIMEMFVKMMVFPVCNRLEGIDPKYVSDIWEAQVKMDERMAEESHDMTEDERKYDINIAELVEMGYAKIMNSLNS